jgi:hypothetical protein
MTHRSLLSLLEDFVDGELSDEDAERVRAMIAESPNIRSDYELSRLVKGLLHSKGSYDPGDAYFDELTELIRARTTRGTGIESERISARVASSERRAFARSLISAVASLILLFTALFIGSKRDLLITDMNQGDQGVVITADVSRELKTFRTELGSVEQRQNLGQGMFLLSPPGMASRFLVLPDYLGH